MGNLRRDVSADGSRPVVGRPGGEASPAADAAASARVGNPGPPLWLLCELTYTCPLHCVFCYNPTDFAKPHEELSTADWLRVLRQGRELGAVQLGLSGGEPLTRDDLEIIVAEAHTLGYYTNLITSGIGLTEARIAALKEAGLDHIQLSFQDSTREVNDFLSSTRTFELKSKVAALIKKYEYPMVLNVVLHRLNIDHVQQILEMAQSMQAEYVELANTQYYGWALRNRAALLPTREQLAAAGPIVRQAKQRLGDRMEIVYVIADYHEANPKPCMYGWGAHNLTVAPNGDVLPCPAANVITTLPVQNVLRSSLSEIWYGSETFNAYRGTDWMQEPCRSCPRKEIDFGGCRCQAFQLTGDAAATDPVCTLSPDHGLVQGILADEITSERPAFAMRRSV